MTKSIIFSAIMMITPAAAESPVLNLPIDCMLGESCFIQQYVDLDRSERVRDFGCGAASYDGHKGTDFRLQTRKMMQTGVDVLASAAGRIVGMRNDMADRQMQTGADKAAISGKECGNGVVIDHGERWQTQYCHLKQGSVTVKQGQMVQAGAVLGQVGLSGQTQFPHLHISVRKDGKQVDPFLKPESEGTCGLADGNLWAAELQDDLVYQPTQILNIGIGDGAVSVEDIEEGRFEGFIPSRTSAALVGFVRAINLNEGDQIRVEFMGPDGIIAAKTYDPVPRRKAQQMYFTGKKAPQGGWPAGAYSVLAEVLRDGEVLDVETYEKSTP
jgi:hypothetical protein